MDSTLVIVAGFVIVIVVVVVCVGLGYYQKQRRTKQMRAIAASLGYEFSEGEESLPSALHSFAVLGQGRDHRAANLLSAEVDGAKVLFLDHSYTIGVGKHRSTHRQSILLLESERLDSPVFVLLPERFEQKLQGLMGLQDIDFEHQPQFSAAYVLRGPDESRIRAYFDPEKLAFFVGRKGLSVEGNGRSLLYYRAGKRVSPDAVAAFVQEGLAVLNVLSG